jgi:predicted RNA-binding Zn ribbon-like protein
MLFTHDTEVMLACTAALVNTAEPSEDMLATVEQLDAFVDEWQFTGSRTHDQHELRAMQRLRARLQTAWGMDVEELVDEVNELLRQAKALPQLVKHDALGYHIHATDADQPLATRIAVEFAMAMIDVIRSGEVGRLQVCASDDCDDVLVDLSRNRSKRFCSVGCGNRENVAAYRARRRS